MHIHTHTHIRIYMYIYYVRQTCICTCASICICMCICICICICIYISHDCRGSVRFGSVLAHTRLPPVPVTAGSGFTGSGLISSTGSTGSGCTGSTVPPGSAPAFRKHPVVLAGSVSVWHGSQTQDFHSFRLASILWQTLRFLVGTRLFVCFAFRNLVPTPCSHTLLTPLSNSPHSYVILLGNSPE